jgi:hypothetical protein
MSSYAERLRAKYGSSDRETQTDRSALVRNMASGGRSTQKSVGQRSQEAAAAKAAADEAAAKATADSAAAADAAAVQTAEQPTTPAEIKLAADRLEDEINSLEMQARGQAPVMGRATAAMRQKQEVDREEIARTLKAKRKEYTALIDRLVEIEPMSRPTQRYRMPAEDTSAVYPERGFEKAQENVLRAETGDRTLARFYKDDFVGDMGESNLNLPRAEPLSVTLPLADGGTAEYTRSRAEDREARSTSLIPFASPRMEGGPLTSAVRMAEMQVDKAFGGDPSMQDYFPEDYTRRGGKFSIPVATGDINMEKLAAEMSKRNRYIIGNTERIKELEKGLDAGGLGGFKGKTYAEIEFLKDENEQMKAELNQMNRIATKTRPEMKRREREGQAAESLTGDFSAQF